MRRHRNAIDVFKKDPPWNLGGIPNEDDITIAIDGEDKLHSTYNGATVSEFDIQNSSSLGEKRKEKALSEGVRPFRAYIKEVGVEPIFTSREELGVAAKIKRCESRV